MPGGEYDQFEESVRPYMFLPFIQVGARQTSGVHGPIHEWHDGLMHPACVSSGLPWLFQPRS
jgi:hypothetical protein